MLVIARKPQQSIVLMPTPGIVPRQLTLAKLFAESPIAIKNFYAPWNQIEAEIVVPNDLLHVESSSDRFKQWFYFYPRETLDLRRITLERLFANGPIVFSVIWTRHGGVRLGIEAPPEIAVKRSEVLLRQAS